ncbi:hypothetical protein pb186bvf_005555 [Paramecium bursaria]
MMDLPSPLKNKINLLVERRKNLKSQEKDINRSNLMHRYKKAINRQNSNQQKTVENLLEIEKSNVLEYLERTQRNSKRLPTLDQSTISFQENQFEDLEHSAVFQKSSKTNRSASTNVSCFNTHSPSVPRSEKSDHDKQIRLLENHLQHQQDLNQAQLREIHNLKQDKLELIQQMQVMEKQHLKFQKQTELFKENLVSKLTSYAKKLEVLNENEEKLQIIQQENCRLKQEKEELIYILRNTKKF